MARARIRLYPRTLTGRLLLWHAVALLGVLAILGVVVDRALERHFVGQLTDSLIADARFVLGEVEAAPAPQPEVAALAPRLGLRITVIRVDGVVLADSEHDPATMENHRARSEIREALAGEIGVASRHSATVGTSFRYVALPPSDGRIVRVALPLTEVQTSLTSIRWVLVAGFGIATVAGLMALAVISRRLNRPLRRISASVERVGQGKLDTEVPEEGSRELVALATTVNKMRDEVAARIAAMERDRATRDAILAALEEGIVLFDRAGDVVYQNDTARKLLGPVSSVRSLVPSELRELLDTGAARRAERSVEVETGSPPAVLLATAAPVPGQEEILFVVLDVTRARALDAVRRDFVANASHELKTPVASIRALAEAVSAAAVDDPATVPGFVAHLERETARLSRIVSDLLDLSRLETRPLGRTELRLDRLLAEEAERYRSRAGEAGLRLEIEPGAAVLVAGSQEDLRLLVRNLVENAIQYTKPGGVVQVGLASDAQAAVLRVSDTGIGIPVMDQARVFERFYRVDRARSRETGGTGLGLSIVKHVAENHGGSVTVASRLGKGTTFTVRLPVR